MKNFMSFLLLVIGVISLSVASSLGTWYYLGKDNPTKDATTTNVQIEEIIEQVRNPRFTTPMDVLQFYQRIENQYETDSIFEIIPEDVLINISNVVIGRNGYATKETIVEEYTKNYRAVYQYIKPNAITTSNNNDTIKLPPHSKSDTVINGKHFKLIKEGGTENGN